MPEPRCPLAVGSRAAATAICLSAAAFLALPTPASAAAAAASQAPTASSGAEAEADSPPRDRAVLVLRRTELEREIAAAPDDPAPKIRLAEILVALDEDEPARIAALEGLATLKAAGENTGKLTADAHLVLATLDRRAGRLAEAIRRYQSTLAADSERLPALIGLAGTLAQAGLHREAIPVFGLWIREQPDHPGARLGAASAMILAGEHERARLVLEDSLRALPENLDVLDLLARHLAACPDRSVRDGERAVELGLRLVQQVPSAESHETLAMAYAQAGRQEAAVEVQSKLLEELGAEADRATLARWRANLERYRSGLPCCTGQG